MIFDGVQLSIPTTLRCSFADFLGSLRGQKIMKNLLLNILVLATFHQGEFIRRIARRFIPFCGQVQCKCFYLN